MELKKNMGETDRKIRLGAGALIVLWGLFSQSWLGLVGVILLATAWQRTCPAYSLIGMNTLEQDK